MIATYEFIEHVYVIAREIMNTANHENKVIKSWNLSIDYKENYKVIMGTHFDEYVRYYDQYVVSIIPEFIEEEELTREQRIANIRLLSNLFTTMLMVSFKIKQNRTNRSREEEEEKNEPIIQCVKLPKKNLLEELKPFKTDVEYLLKLRIQSLRESIKSALFCDYDVDIDWIICRQLFTDNTLPEQLEINTRLSHKDELAIARQLFDKINKSSIVQCG